MTDLARLFDFAANDVIRSADVDAELSQLVAGHNAQEDALEVLATYRTLRAFTVLGTTLAPGTGVAGADGTIRNSASAAEAAIFVPINAADYAVTGKTPKLRLRSQLATFVAPTVNITASLRQVTAISGGGVLTLGAAVVTNTFNAPAAASLLSLASADFNLPPDGLYVFVLTASGGPAGSYIVNGQLELRHV